MKILAAMAFLAFSPPDAPVELCAPVAQEVAREAQSRFEEAEALLLEARWVDAERSLREVLDRHPGHALALYGLGQALIEQGRPGDAARAFESSRTAFRCVLDADAEQRQALEFEREAQLQQLRQSLWNMERRTLVEQSIPNQQVNSHEPAPTHGDIIRRRRALEAAIEEIEQARRSADPSPAGLALALGTALIQSGDFVGAERELRAAVAAAPKSGDARNNLAVALMLTGQLDEAERQARQAEELGVPVSPKLYAEIRRRRK